MSQEEIVLGERSKLQRVLQQAGSCRESRFREALHTWIVTRYRIVYAVEIQTVALRQNVKLVGNREVQITPAVSKKLGQFRLERIQFNHARRQRHEDISRAV